jgi:hypothetical protein
VTEPSRARRTGDDADSDVDRPSATKTPRWVKIFGIVALVLLHVFAILHLTGNGLGGHGAHHGHGSTQGAP